MKKIRAIHDSGYKYIFSHKGFIKQLLQSFVPMDWVNEIDFKNMEHVNASFIRKNFKNKESDIIYKLNYKDKPFYLYLLIEFQSTVDKSMPLRILSYVIDFYENLLRKEKLSELPEVFPILIYNGNEKWTVPDNIINMISSYTKEIKEYLPSLKYYKIIINEFSKDSLARMMTSLAGIFLAENLKDESELEKYHKILAEILVKEVDIELREALVNWFCRLADNESIKPIKDISLITLEEAKTMFATTIEKIKKSERKEGKIETAIKMYKKGYDLETISDITELSITELKKALKL